MVREDQERREKYGMQPFVLMTIDDFIQVLMLMSLCAVLMSLVTLFIGVDVIYDFVCRSKCVNQKLIDICHIESYFTECHGNKKDKYLFIYCKITRIYSFNISTYLPFPVIGSLNGVHMFGDNHDISLLSTTTDDSKIVWRVFHDSWVMAMDFYLQCEAIFNKIYNTILPAIYSNSLSLPEISEDITVYFHYLMFVSVDNIISFDILRTEIKRLMDFSNITLIVVTEDDLADDCHLNNLLNYVFNSMVLLCGLDELTNIKNVEKLKREIKVCI
ncbi:hypothetical protein KUTeg_022754 [Tegillarca granosa]|uniref:FUZ/MON1/HPS1 first Longin domain-containing protein n=1 Tax=Tegillarca granosa TaxID=220873 RepID=A0ABQ9E3G6_TEGGR|nr:hypothetical protein KUTeg_022754 [Tegillarca granosa]